MGAGPLIEEKRLSYPISLTEHVTLIVQSSHDKNYRIKQQTKRKRKNKPERTASQ